jgi:hypothetical protein
MSPKRCATATAVRPEGHATAQRALTKRKIKYMLNSQIHQYKRI